jgi:hypothetical protein
MPINWGDDGEPIEYVDQERDELLITFEQDWELQEKHEVDKLRGLTRKTFKTPTLLTRTRDLWLWIFGFVTGLICNYMASWIYEMWPPHKK